MRAVWEKAVNEEGGRCTEHGFDFKANCINDYVAKMKARMSCHRRTTNMGLCRSTSNWAARRHHRGDQTAAHEWTRAIQALEGVNRFNAGALPKKLGIPTPSEWARRGRGKSPG